MDAGIDSAFSHQFNVLNVSREDYTNFLFALSESGYLDIIMQNQTFICGKCGSFTMPTKSVYPTLQKVWEESTLAEELLKRLCEKTNIEPWHFDFVDQPDDVVERLVEDMNDYLEAKEAIQSGEFMVVENVVYHFLYEECTIIFDPKCECQDVLKY